MAEDPSNVVDNEQAVEEEVWNAISAFEQILEAMPEDRASLEALSHAYEQIGDHTRCKDYLLRLSKVLIESAEAEEARGILDKLKNYAAEDARAQEMVERIEAMTAPSSATPATPEQESHAGYADAAEDDYLAADFSIGDELTVAWHLLEKGELSQDEYASVVQDLTEMSTKEAGGTASVLHVLELRGARNIERIMRIIAEECGTPILSLSGFDIQPEPASAMPLDYMLRRGVLAFEFMGQHAMVVVMNPYDQGLQDNVETALGRKCHFFISLPSEFDSAMVRVKDLLMGV